MDWKGEKCVADRKREHEAKDFEWVFGGQITLSRLIIYVTAYWQLSSASSKCHKQDHLIIYSQNKEGCGVCLIDEEVWPGLCYLSFSSLCLWHSLYILWICSSLPATGKQENIIR